MSIDVSEVRAASIIRAQNTSRHIFHIHSPVYLRSSAHFIQQYIIQRWYVICGVYTKNRNRKPLQVAEFEGTTPRGPKPASGHDPQARPSLGHCHNSIEHSELGKGKGKAVPLQAMEALGGRGGIAPTHSRPRH
jgi:hypothetical protein